MGRVGEQAQTLLVRAGRFAFARGNVQRGLRGIAGAVRCAVAGLGRL